jgi:hypothetical protein
MSDCEPSEWMDRGGAVVAKETRKVFHPWESIFI